MSINLYKNKGFTLLEVMITVLIIGIIAAIAYPSYQETVRKTRRAAAQADLLELQSYMERLYTENTNYNTNTAAQIITGSTISNNYYTYTPSTLNAQNYILTATPKTTGPQTSDRCGALTLSNTGVKGAAKTDCW